MIYNIYQKGLKIEKTYNKIESRIVIADFKRVDWPVQGYTVADTHEDETTAEYIAIKESVNINKDYYIARYQAGIPGTTQSATSSHGKGADGDLKPSKPQVGVWNFIAWGVIIYKER